MTSSWIFCWWGSSRSLKRSLRRRLPPNDGIIQGEALPELAGPGGTFFDAAMMAQAKAHFEAIERLSVEEAWL